MKIYAGPDAAYPSGRVPNVAYPGAVPDPAYPSGRFSNPAYPTGAVPNQAYPGHWFRDAGYVAPAEESVIVLLLAETGDILLDEAGSPILEE